VKLLKKRGYIFWGLVVVLFISWIVFARIRAVRANQPVIQTARVERGTVVSSVSASGVLQPLTTVDVKSNAGGRVEVLAVDVGSVVKAGQLIAKIDPTDSQTALNQAQADLAAAKARLAQTEESLRLQREQSEAQIQQAEEAYRAARARLEQAEIEAKTQPVLAKTAIQQAEANYQSALYALEQLKKAEIPQGIAQARSTFDQAKAAFEKAKVNLERQQRLYEKGFISANQLESSQLEYETCKAQLDSASERMNTVKSEYDAQLKAAEARLEQAKAALESAKANAVQADIKRKEAMAARAALKQAEVALEAARSNARQVQIKAADIRTARAEIVRSQAQVENARAQLDYTIIRAPRDGIILQKYVEVGTIITSGRSSFAGTGQGTSIVQLGDCSRMFVEASVDETDIAQVEVGQTVEITLDAYPDELFEGIVRKINPQTVVEQNVTTIPVTVEILNPDARLKPGMNATCNFIVERKENVLVVPTEAVKEEDGRYTVTMLKEHKQVEREVISGLREGDVVVTAVIEPQSLSTQGGQGMRRRGPLGPPP
jgi:HlyD family secretion protein